MKGSFKEKTFTILLFVVSVSIGFVLLEIGSYITLRYLIKHHNLVDHRNKSDWYLTIYNRESDILPHGIKRNYRQRFCGREFNTIIQTNNVGLREDKDFNGEKIDIGFVGDSFVFGHGVNYGERFSDLLRSYFPGKNILSLSRLNGFTTPHYYLFLKKNPQYIPHILILGLFPYNDLGTDISTTNFIFDKEGELVSAKSSKIYVNDEGTLVSKGSFIITRKVMDFLLSFNTGKLIIIAYGRLKGIYQSGRKSNHLSSLHRGELNKTNLIGLDYIQKLKKYLDERGSRLIVFIIPVSYVVGDYPERCPYTDSLCVELKQQKYLQKSIQKRLREHKIEFIDPTDEFIEREKNGVKLYYKWDGHWNKNGHKVAAELVFRYLQYGKL